MNPLRVSLTFPVAKAPDDLEPAIATFHRFIQRRLVEGLILDVADYRHVPEGPDVLLIGHDIDYGISGEAFTVVRKRSADDSAATQVRDALRMGLGALDAIAADGELGVVVDTSRFTVRVHDRRLGEPDEVAAKLQVEVAPLAAELYGSEATVGVVASDDRRQAPTVSVEVPAEAAADTLTKLGGAQAGGQSPWDISADELARLRDSDADFVLLDVREPSEYEAVNIGGRLVPLGTLDAHVDELDPDAHIVVHCRAGGRGAEAVGKLRDAGFTDVWNLNGGLMAWIDRIDPTLPRY